MEVYFFVCVSLNFIFLVKWAVTDQIVTVHVGAILLDCYSLRCYVCNMWKYYSGFCFFLILCVCGRKELTLSAQPRSQAQEVSAHFW